jgi:xanthine dehydrogenase molybdopterin-binding subunit B
MCLDSRFKFARAGIGFFLTEECVYDASTGRLINNGTWDYKPPESLDIPLDLRVSLLPHAPNPSGILRSKGTGEPPYILAASVYFAVCEAVAAARRDAGLPALSVPLPLPASVAVVQQACGIDLSQLILQ